MEEKIKFNVENVNISDIMSQIHKSMEVRGYDMERINTLKNFNIKSKVENYPNYLDGNLSPLANMVTQKAAIQYWWSIPNESGLRKKIKIFRYKVTRKFMFFYMKYVMEQQNSFNGGVAYTINALVEKNDKLERENKELYKCMAMLTKEIGSIKKKMKEQKSI